MSNTSLLPRPIAAETKKPRVRAVDAARKPIVTSEKSRIITVPYYPPVLMPEQPQGYLKPRKYEFF